MNYRSAVAEAKRLTKRSDEDQWRLAELTWNVVQEGTSRRQWGRDVGWKSTSMARMFYEVWGRWGGHGAETRPRFTDAWETIRAGSEELIDGTQARRDRALRQLPEKHEHRVEMVRKLLKDEQVAEAIVEDTTSMANIAKADVAKASPRGRSAQREIADELGIWQLLYKARRSITKALREAKDQMLRKAERDELLEEVRYVRTALDWLESYLESGDKSWEDALAEWEVEGSR